MYDIFDIAAGDSTLGQDLLTTNAYHSGTFKSAAAVNRAQYPFLIFVVKAIPGQTAYDLDASNNQYITYAPISLSYQSFDKSLAKSGIFKVEKSEGLISMQNISNSSSNSTYVLYSMNGEKIKEGIFTQATQFSTDSLPSGIYVIKVSNDSIQETIKVFIGQ